MSQKNQAQKQNQDGEDNIVFVIEGFDEDGELTDRVVHRHRSDAEREAEMLPALALAADLEITPTPESEIGDDERIFIGKGGN